jgi:exo-1,4-beta-D-glucosaminidase
MKLHKFVQHSFSSLLSSIILLFCFSNYSQANPYTIKLNVNWYIQSSERLNVEESIISLKGYSTAGWYKTDVPKTVLAALVEKGVYKDPYYAMNLSKIAKNTFEQPWWYRNEFVINENIEGNNYQIIFEGINYKADLWVNGKKIASKDEFEGAFGIFNFNITSVVAKGTNVIAVKIYPPVKGDLTLGFVDWNPESPDQNMGIWRNVKLKTTASVSMDDVFVQSKLNLETLAEADLIVSARLSNISTKPIHGSVQGEIEGRRFSKEISLDANSQKDIVFTINDDDELKIKNPRIWWPNNLGKPNLYNLKMKILIGKDVSDQQSIRFGIRDVQDYFTEKGYRGFKINGKKIMIKGAGWVDDLLLNDSDEKVVSQVEYAKHMNLNTIRLEGFWGKNETLYDAADENGILIMLGWSCQWEWKGYCGREETDYMSIQTQHDIELQSEAYIDQVKWLRNHPSIFLWVLGSDKLPSPELETKMNNLLKIYDPTRPILASCKGIEANGEGNISKVSGYNGVKMLGPYEYVTPNYWYLDDKLGGAYGFNTETGPGAQVPPLESLRRMIPEQNLWPIDSVWNFHCGKNEFSNLNKYIHALDSRYGKAKSVEEFAAKSQMVNYEAMRPMFESFGVNKFNSTGVIQWMFNSAWPEMFWQLFDYYLMPNGAFYGAKKGCQPLNPIYNYKDKNIYVVNDYNHPIKKITASVKRYNTDSKLIFESTFLFDIAENCSRKIFDLPADKNNVGLSFLSLELRNIKGKLISDNFYWLSAEEDVLDFENSEWYYTPCKSYADFKQINSMPKADINYTFKLKKENGKEVIEVTLKNDSNVLAFFVELMLIDEKTGQSILPIFWSDNYVSILPQSKKTITGYFANLDGNVKPRLTVKGWNTD